MNRSTDSMNFVQAIRSAATLIVKNFDQNDISHKVLDDLITEISAKKLEVERLYLMYSLMQLLTELPAPAVVRFFQKVLPVPLSENGRLFVEQMISLAISLDKKSILTATSVYLDAGAISLPDEMDDLPDDLAVQSPEFVAVIIGRDSLKDEKTFPPKLLKRWLTDLVQNDTPVSFDGRHLIRHSLLDSHVSDSQLHLLILTCMQKKKVRPLNANFMLSVGKEISSPEASDRFAQILVVAIQSGLVSDLTPQVKKQMQKSFAHNELLSLFLKSIT